MLMIHVHPVLFQSLYRKALWPSQEVRGEEPEHLDSRSVCGRLGTSLESKLFPLIVTSDIVENVSFTYIILLDPPTLLRKAETIALLF